MGARSPLPKAQIDAVNRKFGSWCKAQRRKIVMTQADLAEATGYSRPTIANIEMGSTNVTLVQAMAIFDAFENGADEAEQWKRVRAKIDSRAPYNTKRRQG
jgi:transcriptional regulator with XRE-family HTH domain